MKTNGDLDAFDRAIIRLREEGKSKAELRDGLREIGLGMSDRSLQKRITNLITKGHIKRQGNGSPGGRYDWAHLGPQIRRMIEIDGQTIAATARTLGMPRDTVAQWMLREGVRLSTSAAAIHSEPVEGRTFASRGPLPAGHPTALACIGLDPETFEVFRL